MLSLSISMVVHNLVVNHEDAIDPDNGQYLRKGLEVTVLLNLMHNSTYI